MINRRSLPVLAIVMMFVFCIAAAFGAGYLMGGGPAAAAVYAQEDPSEPTPAPTATPEPINMDLESGIDGLVVCEVDIEEFETFITLAGAHDDCADPVEWAEITIDWERDVVTWNETVLVNRTLFEFGRWVQP